MAITKKSRATVAEAENSLRELRIRRESLEARRRLLSGDLTNDDGSAVASALAGLDLILRESEKKIAAAEQGLADARGDVGRERHAQAIETALERVEAAYPKVIAELRSFADLLDQTETPEAQGLASHLRWQAQALEDERSRQIQPYRRHRPARTRTADWAALRPGRPAGFDPPPYAAARPALLENCSKTARKLLENSTGPHI